MRYNIRGNVEVTDAIRSYIENKLDKLEKYFNEEMTANVYIRTYEHSGEQKIEVTIPLKNLTLKAEDKELDLYAAIDLVLDKLERQIRKFKTRVNKKSRKRKGQDKELYLSSFSQVSDFAEDDEDEDEVIRRKTFDLKPMDLEEAIMQMSMLGHNFFVFKDIETSGTSVVYLRKDNTYGLIETNN